MSPVTETKKRLSIEDLSSDALKALHQTATELLTLLQILLKLSRIYHPHNINVIKHIKHFSTLLQFVLNDMGEAQFKVRKSSVFFNNLRLKYGFSNYHIFKSVLQELAKRDIGVLAFRPGISEEELARFVQIVARAEGKGKASFEELAGGLIQQGIEHISIEKTADPSRTTGKEKATAKIYFLSLIHLKDAFEKKKEEKINLSTTRRLMQSIFNHIVENESFVYGMTNIKNYDEYTLNHSVNVCLLSIALGRRLGLDRHELVDLGISAFFHDFGKLDTPKEILEKPAKLDDQERHIIEKHPFHGAGKLVQMREFKNFPLKALNVALEHHVREDLSGYPKYFKKQSTHLFSKIVKIADYFDAITTKRVYRAKHFTRDEALTLMMEQGPKEFHPLLLRVFVQMMGVYPVGTFVALDTGEIGLITETSLEPAYVLRPKAKLITNPAGQKIDGDVVDLAEKDPATQKYKRSVLKTLDPEKYHLKASDYFLVRAAS